MSVRNPKPLAYTARSVVLFFMLAFVMAWIFFIPAVVLAPSNLQLIFIILGAFGPFLAAVIIILYERGISDLRVWLRGVFRFRIPLILYLAGAFLIPIGIGGLQYALYRLLGGEADFSNAIPWSWYLFYLIPTALLSGGNEEPGWRGFALPALLQWFHPLSASLILGTLHAAWHLPLMEHYDTTFGWYLFDLIPLTFIFNWFYFNSKSSVVPVMLLHAGLNVIGSFIPTPMDVLGGFGTFMVLRGGIYWLIAIPIMILTKGSLGYKNDCGYLLYNYDME